MGEAQYQVNCLPGPRELFKQDTADLAPRAIAWYVDSTASTTYLLVLAITYERRCALTWPLPLVSAPPPGDRLLCGVRPRTKHYLIVAVCPRRAASVPLRPAPSRSVPLRPAPSR